jgi:chromosome transmission fidelity protein 1
LGRVLQNLARVVPGGIVLFFPSYRFEEVVFQRWLSDGRLNQICTHKKLFREPKNADELDKVLQEYATAAKGQSGAILTSVVGGKMSEGINFSDDLARCVVMVGLPYPNAQDPELVEKMNFFDTNPSSGTTGREFYENLCIKAVNQSIGRAIRHQKDYASILLLDRRYSNPSIRKRLPLWIQKRVQQNPGGISSTSDRPTMPLTFGQVYPQLIKFYRSKK